VRANLFSGETPPFPDDFKPSDLSAPGGEIRKEAVFWLLKNGVMRDGIYLTLPSPVKERGIAISAQNLISYQTKYICQGVVVHTCYELFRGVNFLAWRGNACLFCHSSVMRWNSPSSSEFTKERERLANSRKEEAFALLVCRL
jgi:hypothetical protein